MSAECLILLRARSGRGLLALLAFLGGGGFLGGLLLGEKDSVDVGEDTTGSDGDTTEELVELFVVADSELNVTGSDARALVVAGGVTGQLEDLGGEVFHHGGEVDGGTATDAGGVAALPQEAGHTADGELEASASRASLGLARGFSLTTTTFTFSRHVRFKKDSKEQFWFFTSPVLV